MPVDPPRARDLFLAAADLPPDRRLAFLAGACGPDAELRAEVDRLLAAHADPASVLDPDLAATGAFDPPSPAADHRPGDAPGLVLAGRYKLVEPVGEGGMGSVWLAQQTEPVKRAVAVKLIKAGMDSKQVLARFEAERQALALMDHPNIAKVLDAGLTPDGRPFFVMELVKGTPITDFCDARRLTPRQRLELFVPVCQAVQHAHQKGVIHRDLKPSNVLVALYDDRPVPKVIDFGVAKATGQALIDHTLMTGFGAVVGTPEYMSPEQASFNNLDIDTRSDVYALGVLLYELLTGSPPHPRAELQKAGVLEILRVVREQDPPRPSARLSTSDALASIAAVRGTEPGRLTRLVRGELDWLVMKALEKDRTRRYETATALAAEVMRYLAGEPVEGVPPSVGYRLRKAYRRNRGAVLGAAAFAAVLLAGAGVSVAFGLSAAAAEHQAARDRDDAIASARLADERAVALGAEQERTDGLFHVSQINHAQVAAAEYRNPRLLTLLAETTPRPGKPDRRGWEWHYLDRLVRGWEAETRLEGLVVSGLRWNAQADMVTSRDGSRFVVPPSEPDLPFDQRGDRRGGMAAARLVPPLPALVIDTATGKVLVTRAVKAGTLGHRVSPCGRFLAYFEPVEPDEKVDPRRNPAGRSVPSRVRLMEIATGQDIPVPIPSMPSEGRIWLSEGADRLTVVTNPSAWRNGGMWGGERGGRAQADDRDKTLVMWERGQEQSARRLIPTGPARPSAVLEHLSPDGRTALLVHSPGPPDRLLPSADRGQVLEAWDVAAAEPKVLWTHKPGGSILAVGMSGDGSVLAAAHADQRTAGWKPIFNLFDIRTGKPRGRWVGPAGTFQWGVSSVMAVSDDARRVVVSEGTDLLVVGERTDAGPPGEPGRWRTHVRRSPLGPDDLGLARGCFSLWASPDGSRLASVELQWRKGPSRDAGDATGDGVVRRTWDLTRNPEYAGTWPDRLTVDGEACEAVPDPRSRQVSYPLAFSPADKKAGAKPPAGWAVVVYDPLRGQVTHRFEWPERLGRAEVGPDGTRVLLAVREVGKESDPEAPPDGRQMKLAYLLRTAGRPGGEQVLLRIEGSPLDPGVPGMSVPGIAVAPYFTGDGRWVVGTVLMRSSPGRNYVSTSRPAEFTVWRAADGKHCCTIPMDPDWIPTLTHAPGPDGGRLIIQSRRAPPAEGEEAPRYSTRVICLDPANGNQLWSYEVPGQDHTMVQPVEVSADGRQLAVATLDYGAEGVVVRVLDTGTGTVVRELRGGPVPRGGMIGGTGMRFAAFGPAGAFALCVANQVLVWDGRGPDPAHRLAAPTPIGVLFSADGRRLFALDSSPRGGSEERAVRVWDLATGRELLALRLPREGTFRPSKGSLGNDAAPMWLEGERLMLWWGDGIRVFDGTPAK